jgi:hypothetical protein
MRSMLHRLSLPLLLGALSAAGCAGAALAPMVPAPTDAAVAGTVAPVATARPERLEMHGHVRTDEFF